MGQYTAASVCKKKSYANLSTEELLESALQERDALLKQRPKLRAYQKEIDRLVLNAGSVENRLMVLSMMIEAKFEELRTHIACLILLSNKMDRYCCLQ